MSNNASWDFTQGGLYLPSTHKASPVSLCLKSGYFGFFCNQNQNANKVLTFKSASYISTRIQVNYTVKETYKY